MSKLRPANRTCATAPARLSSCAAMNRPPSRKAVSHHVKLAGDELYSTNTGSQQEYSEGTPNFARSHYSCLLYAPLRRLKTYYVKVGPAKTRGAAPQVFSHLRALRALR